MLCCCRRTIKYIMDKRLAELSVTEKGERIGVNEDANLGVGLEQPVLSMVKGCCQIFVAKS